jgi:hypothetical protein
MMMTAVRAQVGEGSGPDGCWNNITEMNNDLGNRTGFASKVYEICVNTTFDLTNVDLALQFRSNVRYQSGPNSDPSDQCVFYGGKLLILNVGIFGDIIHDNVQVAGLTFTGPVDVFAAMNIDGDFHFHNCIFQVTNENEKSDGNNHDC